MCSAPRATPGVKRLVYAGSSSAYGDTPTLPKREDMPPSPRSPYALQKLVAEQYCQMFTRLYGFETVTTRYFNVFGPRQDPGSPYSGVISLFSTALLEGRAPVIYGDGEQTRDFTFVANVVDGVLRACEAPNAAGEVINVACGGRISLNELLAVMNGLVGTNSAADLQAGAGGRRQGFAGGHCEGGRAARLQAARCTRRRSAAHARVVPHGVETAHSLVTEIVLCLEAEQVGLECDVDCDVTRKSGGDRQRVTAIDRV